MEVFKHFAIRLPWLGMTALLFGAFLGGDLVQASDVEVRLSSREAYVGSPLSLQIEITDAKQPVETPELPEIPGVKVRRSGDAPQRQTNVSIINGQYNVRETVTFTFLLTPQREGEFQIPEFRVDAGDKVHRVEGVKFVATRSETGDLLFVEVVGNQQEVFVGQPVELALRIWVKPFADRERGFKLSEWAMWKCLSESTSWGPFAERMEQLANNGQRPGGEEVLREDSQGINRSYYLYQIDATIYPDRPGQLRMDDVALVFNYPTELGRQRSPMSRLLDSQGLGGLDDGFFNSPFDNRLAVTRYRPIIADAPVSNTNVLPVPTSGRPVDYQGAVGVYRLEVRASKQNVSVGEPIPLELRIQGDGPLNVIQPPALDRVESLTADFRVSSDPLAGTVEGNSKRFQTTIRPRDVNVNQIPPIPFSFFDPQKRQYITVYSDPIPLKVNAAASLAMDDIVSGAAGAADERDMESALSASEQNGWKLPSWSTPVDLQNHFTAEMLAAESPTLTSRRSLAWWLLWILPPLAWLIGWGWKRRHLSWGWERHLTGRAALEQAESLESLALNLGRAVAQCCAQKMDAPVPTIEPGVEAVARLRLMGDYPLAAELETLLTRCSEGTAPLEVLRGEAIELWQRIQRQVQTRQPRTVSVKTSMRKLAGQVSILVFVLVAVSGSSLPPVRAQYADTPKPDWSATLEQATRLYNATLEEADLEVSVRDDRYQQVIRQYRAAVDHGIENRDLYLALGNVYASSDQLGWAVWAYQKALQFSPGDAQVLSNLREVEDRIEPAPNRYFWPTRSQSMTLAGVGWLVFWGFLIARQWTRQPHWAWSLTALLATLVGLMGVWNHRSEPDLLVVVDRLDVRSADGETFPIITTLEGIDGHRLSQKASRGEWLEVAFESQKTGWVPAQSVVPTVK